MTYSNTSPRKREIGQGLVEYGLVLILFAIAVIVIFALLGNAVGNIFNGIENPCFHSDSFECLDHKVNQCLASEKYTKEQCVQLVGGHK